MQSRFENVWLKDADNIDISAINIDTLIYQNQAVEEYLTKPGKLCIIATKGVGKTLLLKYKRYKMQEAMEEKGVAPAAVLIPYNNPLDTFELTLTLSESKQRLFGNRRTWENIWKFSLSISSIVFYTLKKRDAHFLKDLQLEFKDKNIQLSMIAGIGQRMDEITEKVENRLSVPDHLINSFNPSELIKDIIGSSENAIREIIEEALVILPRYYKAIDLSIAIFIDRVDQALRNYPNKIWYESQLGLLEAAFNLFRDKAHIKTFCSIRKEAYANYKSELREQTKDIITLLNFEPTDLEEIFKKAIQAYEPSDITTNRSLIKEDPIRAFTCQEKILNRNAKIEEDIFKYIYRHTLGRPRDLMIIGEQIHTERWRGQNKIRNLEEESLINIVNKTMSQEIEKAYLIEVERFLNSIKGSLIKKLFGYINKNVLNLKDLQGACKNFSAAHDCDSKCLSCNVSHAFCELYNIGLLGKVENDRHLGRKIQKFVQLSEIMPPKKYRKRRNNKEQDKSILREENVWYLIHPGLDDFIKKVNNAYSQVEGILIGNGYEWDKTYDYIMQIKEIKSVMYDMPNIEKEDLRLIEQIIDDSKEAIIKRDASAIEKIKRKIPGSLEKIDFIIRIINILNEVFRLSTTWGTTTTGS